MRELSNRRQPHPSGPGSAAAAAKSVTGEALGEAGLGRAAAGEEEEQEKRTQQVEEHVAAGEEERGERE